MTDRRDLVVHVAEIRRHVGGQLPVDLSVSTEDLWAEPLQLASFEVGVDADHHVTAALLLESVAGGVAVSGGVAGRWSGACRRCLGTVGGPIEVEIHEVFEDRSTEGDTYPIDGDTINLGDMIREALLLALPAAPLCRTNCVGVDPDTFPVVVGPDAVAPRDDRWAGLDELRDSLS